MIYANANKIECKPFKYNLYNLEEYLCDYDKYATTRDIDINELLEYAFKNISKRMIIFVITDMSGSNIYDVNEKEYIPEFLLNDKKLMEIEMQIKNDLIKKNTNKLKKNNISYKNINSTHNISYKIVELLEEHRYASTN